VFAHVVEACGEALAECGFDAGERVGMAPWDGPAAEDDRVTRADAVQLARQRGERVHAGEGPERRGRVP
jgi:hypothetical protein